MLLSSRPRVQSRRQYRHWVFARGDEPCRRCGSGIIEEVIAGRRLYYCPVCQPGLTK